MFVFIFTSKYCPNQARLKFVVINVLKFINPNRPVLLVGNTSTNFHQNIVLICTISNS